ncbi:peptidylprolyl isomerase [Microcella daejeonensis]|uniref:peptidylprolyl isomerase n=1 Tax=Microcella daejeonensis TaxID=2994971 RepID=A0A9E8MKC9_9MICO|nr:peptidylprolyl isomerase [Microcella daejeonensis]WAB81178.1 peptidylprolyl isomerase [Microcella daejeonensis]
MARIAGQDREARERLKRYEARQTVHRTQIDRRRRDNVLVAVVGVLVIALAVGAQLLYFGAGPGAPSTTPSASPSPGASETPAASDEPTGQAPDPAVSENRTWTGELAIDGIEPLGIELDGAAAPQAVASFVTLAQEGFFDGTSCHRLTTAGIFVLQCGDPNGDGTGGPDYRFGPIENAPDDDVYAEGVLAMARQGGNAESQGSQFFIVYDESTIPSDAAGGYTVLGRVTSGLDGLRTGIVDAGTEDGASDGRPAVPATISGITIQ